MPGAVPSRTGPAACPLAPASQRVDPPRRRSPNPTNVTNPLFPVSQQASVSLLGQVDGQAFRTEVTLLPETRIIEWQGQRIEALVSQYAAFLDGRLHEVAYDFYAQDDGGAVWYLGEDVFNFKDGAIADTHGTWIAGKDGPAAMIMPADPQVGDVYRPENIPGFVFEEVTVKAVGRTLDGPLGPVEGGLVIEDSTWTIRRKPRLSVPAMESSSPVAAGTSRHLLWRCRPMRSPNRRPSRSSHWRRVRARCSTRPPRRIGAQRRARSGAMTAAWETVRAGEVPNRLEQQMTRALAALADGVGNRQAADARQAAIDAARWSLDLQLRHRPVTEIDLARFDLWAAQILVDVAAETAGAVAGDIATLESIRDRLIRAVDPSTADQIDLLLIDLRTAVDGGNLSVVAGIATQLGDLIA